MALIERAVPLGGTDDNIYMIINHYIYDANNITTRDKLINTYSYKKVTIKALQRVYGVNMNINGSYFISSLSVGEERTFDIVGDVEITTTYKQTVAFNVQITLHN